MCTGLLAKSPTLQGLGSTFQPLSTGESSSKWSLQATGLGASASQLWMIFFNIKHCLVIHSFLHSPNMAHVLSACHILCLELVMK